MRSDHITHTAARLQHATDELAAAVIDDANVVDTVRSLRLATVDHAEVVSELIHTAHEVLGDLEETRHLPELLQTTFRLTNEMHDELRRGDGRVSPFLVVAFAVILDELLSAERRLICRCGTFLFPAETW